MYPFILLTIIYSNRSWFAGRKLDACIRFFSVIFSFFALQAFLCAQTELHPYENLKFLKTYATLQQSSPQVFENVTLRNTLKNIESAMNVAIWLDRRIDGEQLVQLKSGQRTFLECIQQLCSQTNTEIAWLENILYIAPSGQSSKIEMAYWKLMTERDCEAWRKKGPPLQWDVPTEVKNILEQCKKTLSFKIEGLDRIEHDLWAPKSIPEASIAAQWTCLLSGFDRSLKTVNRQNFMIEEIPEASDVVFEYSTQLQKMKPPQIQEWKANWPTAIAKSGTKKGGTSIKAPVTAHRAIILAGLADRFAVLNKPPEFEKLRSTLDYDGELAGLIGPLGKQIGLTIEPWPLPAETAKRKVHVHVKVASIDEILATIAKQTDLQIKRTDKTVSIQ